MLRMLANIAINRRFDHDPMYLRCSSCGLTGGPLEGVPPPRYTSTIRIRPGKPGVAPERTPLDWTCPRCGRDGPIVTGEILTNDTPMRCRHTLLCRYQWPAPATLSTITCSRCHTTQPGPTHPH